jgi:hypothetical protein
MKINPIYIIVMCLFLIGCASDTKKESVMRISNEPQVGAQSLTHTQYQTVTQAEAYYPWCGNCDSGQAYCKGSCWTCPGSITYPFDPQMNRVATGTVFPSCNANGDAQCATYCSTGSYGVWGDDCRFHCCTTDFPFYYDGLCNKYAPAGLGDTCVDSDSMNLEIKGQVKKSGGMVPPTARYDYCVDTTHVFEYWCPFGSVASSGGQKSCPSGMTCTDGACAEEGTCTDTDGGQKPDLFGTVTDKFGDSISDSCVTSNSQVDEFYCGADGLAANIHMDCQTGYSCKNGVCAKSDECSVGETQCASTTTVQECSSGTWGTPTNCPADKPQCKNNACVQDSCASVTCNNLCVGNTLNYAGKCDPSTPEIPCDYQTTVCADGCETLTAAPYAQCKTPSCAGVGCPDYCMNNKTRYFNGTCTEGRCGFASEECSTSCGVKDGAAICIGGEGFCGNYPGMCIGSVVVIILALFGFGFWYVIKKM